MITEGQTELMSFHCCMFIYSLKINYMMLHKIRTLLFFQQ